MRALLKSKSGRGHVEIRTSLSRALEANSTGYNRRALKSYVAAFRAAAKELQLDSEPDLNVLLAMPGMAGNGSARKRKPLDARFSNCVA